MTSRAPEYDLRLTQEEADVLDAILTEAAAQRRLSDLNLDNVVRRLAAKVRPFRS